MKEFVIIVAGGKGRRMQKDIPKQFLNLQGKPILMHTIDKFFNYSDKIELILVLPEAHFSFWEKLVKEHNFDKKVKVVAGGEMRVDSVRNALNETDFEEEALVAVHDGVRPLVSLQTIEKSFKMASEKGSSVTVVPAKDSLREVTENGSRAVIRANFRQVQTPQTFRIDWLKESYEKVRNTKNITDDASLVESVGYPIFLLEGDYFNIKITTPEDMLIAESLLAKQKTATSL